MKRFIIFINFFILLFQCSESYKILCFFPTVSKSQVLLAQPLMVALAEKGHDVTFVSGYALGKKIQNYNDIVIAVDSATESHDKMASSALKTDDGGKGLGQLNIMATLISNMLLVTNETMNHPIFKKIMEEQSFDVIVHGYAFNMFQLGLAQHFKCPSIVFSSVPPIYSNNKLVGQPSHPEAVPSFISNVKGSMNFLQRVGNMLLQLVEIGLSMYQEYRNERFYESNFPSDKFLPFSEIYKTVALELVNDHFTQGNVKPYLPNVIEIAGIQMTHKPNKLPADIEEWLDGATDGLIFVSFGTNVKSSDMTMERRNALIKNFAKLKQRVLWKFEDESLEGLPKNVMIKKWLPQVDILAHPNTKVFVSHMGIGGYNEAKYYAIPVLAVPFTGDQPMNAMKAQSEGWAEIVSYWDLTEETFNNALSKLLSNSSYKNTVQKLSDLFRDRPISAIDNAIYWIEYVVRHKGAPQLRYPGVELDFIQRNSLDVFAFLFAIIYLVFKTLRFVCGKTVNFCFGSKGDKKLSKKVKGKRD